MPYAMRDLQVKWRILKQTSLPDLVQRGKKELVRGCEIFRHTYRERSEDGTEVGRKVIDSSFAPATVASFRSLSNRGAIGLMGFSAAAIGN